MNAAQKLSEMISSDGSAISKGSSNKSLKFPQQKVESFIKRANSLAKDALNEDENFLAFALATPQASVAVLQFRDSIDNKSATSHSFLHTYWRELGYAWNQTNGANFWGAPFRDCGPLKGRWLWPFSVTVVVQNIK
jgi:G protein-coupled receptor 158